MISSPQFLAAIQPDTSRIDELSVGTFLAWLEVNTWSPGIMEGGHVTCVVRHEKAPVSVNGWRVI